MPIAKSLLPEFDQEMASTRKIIERVPSGKNEWKPHPRSMPLGYMAVHLAKLPEWISMIMTSDDLDIGLMAERGFNMPVFESAEATVAMFDKAVHDSRFLIAGASDELMMKNWTLKNKGTTIFSIPKVATLRTMVFNHIIHHRGQMTVYLRLNDVPLPSLYGPTADEPM
jgi:uncharacterized damage-inducible protein DinB